jgi:hypothetical protein
MAVVARIFRMVGTEGVAIRGVKRTFEREGLPSPQGKEASRLDPEKRYGI